jgi:tetrahydromethanopterin S-methyltransferase subunit G
MMTISEAQRFEMHLGLRNILGDEVANSLMEHLPPSGWSDVARTGDIATISARIDRLETRIDRLDTEMRVGFIIGSMLTVAAGIVASLILLKQTVSGL